MNFASYIRGSGHLELQGLGLTDQDMPALCKFINDHPKIRSIDLSADHSARSNHITEKGLKILADKLADNKSLVALHLSNNPIGNEGMKYVSQLKQLTLLDIKATGINEHGLGYLAPLSKLISLDVSANDLGALGMSVIAVNHPRLSILSAQNCRLHNEQMTPIAELSNLIILDVSYNFLDDQAAKAITKMQKLCFLDSSANRFTKAGLKQIERMQFARLDPKIETQFTRATSEKIQDLAKTHTRQHRQTFWRRLEEDLDFDLGNQSVSSGAKKKI